MLYFMSAEKFHNQKRYQAFKYEEASQTYFLKKFTFSTSQKQENKVLLLTLFNTKTYFGSLKKSSFI